MGQTSSRTADSVIREFHNEQNYNLIDKFCKSSEKGNIELISEIVFSINLSDSYLDLLKYIYENYPPNMEIVEAGKQSNYKYEWILISALNASALKYSESDSTQFGHNLNLLIKFHKDKIDTQYNQVCSIAKYLISQNVKYDIDKLHEITKDKQIMNDFGIQS